MIGTGRDRGLPGPPPTGASALPPGTFDGSVVLVTGGGTGLGRAIAVEFARLGAAVAVASRDAAHRDAGVTAVEAAGGRGLGVPLDVRDESAVTGCFDAVEASLGPVDVLVNNAAGNFPAAAERLSANAWRAVTGIVLDGTFLCSRELATRRIADGRPAVILNIGASYAWTGGPGFAHSAAAKAGVKNLTETLAVEWAPHGIRVNGLVPGLMPHDDESSDIRAVPGRGDHDGRPVPRARVWERHGRSGGRRTFLASPYAAYVTGATLAVDGANWQRRDLVQPPFTPLHDQLGIEPPDDDQRGAPRS